jgi:predicted ribosomally synthesized peptide with nif11-like leader
VPVFGIIKLIKGFIFLAVINHILFQELVIMSNETVKGFFEFLKTSQDLQLQVKNSVSSSDVVRIATSAGYKFSQQDLQDYMKESESQQELGMEELEMAAGGASPNYVANGNFYQC